MGAASSTSAGVCSDRETELEAGASFIGLYLNSPQHAADGFEYKRNGTLSLYADLNTKTGKVQGKTAARHMSLEFVDLAAINRALEGLAR